MLIEVGVDHLVSNDLRERRVAARVGCARRICGCGCVPRVTRTIVMPELECPDWRVCSGDARLEPARIRLA